MRHHIDEMLHSHPHPGGTIDATGACIDACFECSTVCGSCADACLAEGDLERAACIRLNLDCADVCLATGRILSRLVEPDERVIKAQLLACVAACRACAEMCEHHASAHEHCRICAETCRICEQLCLQTVSDYAAMH